MDAFNCTNSTERRCSSATPLMKQRGCFFARFSGKTSRARGLLPLMRMPAYACAAPSIWRVLRCFSDGTRPPPRPSSSHPGAGANIRPVEGCAGDPPWSLPFSPLLPLWAKLRKEPRLNAVPAFFFHLTSIVTCSARSPITEWMPFFLLLDFLVSVSSDERVSCSPILSRIVCSSALHHCVYPLPLCAVLVCCLCILITF